MGVGVRGRWACLSLCQNVEKLLEGGWHPLLNANVILICSTWPAHIPCLQGRAPGPPPVRLASLRTTRRRAKLPIKELYVLLL